MATKGEDAAKTLGQAVNNIAVQREAAAEAARKIAEDRQAARQEQAQGK